MDFMDISKKRITVRKFAQTPIEDEKVQKILEAGRCSPTAVNAQPQRIIVLNTPESLAKVREFCSFGYLMKIKQENCSDCRIIGSRFACSTLVIRQGISSQILV